MSMDDNFFDDVQELPQESTGAAMVRAVNERRCHEESLSQLEEQVKAEKAEISRLDMQEMPKLLKEMGSSLWRHPTEPIQVELVSAVDATQPKEMERRIALFDSLDEIGIYEIIGQEFTITFTPGDRNATVMKYLLGLTQEVVEGEIQLSNHELELIHQFREDLGIQTLPAEEKVGVHPARLKKWLLEKIDAGFGNIIEAAGIWHGKKAKISETKKRK